MEAKNLVQRDRQFNLALRELYSQSLRSSSLENLAAISSQGTNGTGELFSPVKPISSVQQKPNTRKPLEPVVGFLSVSAEQHIGFRGRGRPAFIPQEILDQPLRRPTSIAPPPLPDHVLNNLSAHSADNSEFPQFAEFFNGKLLDNIFIYKAMEQYIFSEAKDVRDLEKMMQFFSKKALVCPRNAPTICKYLYVFSQDPSVGAELRKAFFGTLEKDYMSRQELRSKEGPTKYRNFIKWVMATAHHYRNLLFAPFDDLMLSLLELANDVSEFNDSEDYGLYTQLILRFYYYTSLPCSDGSKVSVKLGEEHVAAIRKAQDYVRPRIAKGALTFEQSHWLMLLLEVTNSSPLIKKEIAEYYQRILPGFNNLLPEALLIKLPQGHGRSQYLDHIKKFIVV